LILQLIKMVPQFHTVEVESKRKTQLYDFSIKYD
jgi:hypothetical protein